MRVRLKHLWESLTSGYWFVPSVMLVASVVLALVLLYVDRNVLTSGGVGWLYSGSPDGAKTMLSAIASSTITVAGVVFSITIAALAQASSQFGPRLLRTFIRDRGNQIVLGTFISTYMYCLLILRDVRTEIEGASMFVPNLSVTVAVLLAAASIAVLIYFIHHVSVELQAPSVVAKVREDLEQAVARLSSDQKGSGIRAGIRPDQPDVPQCGDDAFEITSDREGYIQAIDYLTLLDQAASHNLILWLEHRPGDFVMEGSRLARAWPVRSGDDELGVEVKKAFITGKQGTSEQDIEYTFRQMVEVAVRALSPGVNDPFTAINCIDALGAGICRVARSGLPGPLRYDDKGELRIVTPVSTFAGVLDVAFNQIRQYGRDSVSVTTRLLEVLRACGEQVKTREQRRTLLHHAEMIYRQSQEATPEVRDRQDIRERWESAVAVLSDRENPDESDIPPDHKRIELYSDSDEADRQTAGQS